MSTPLTTNNSRQPDLQSLKTIATVVYALQAASLFLVFPYFIAVILSYIKRDDAHGTWLESHFRWQIRTFWFGLPWIMLGFVTYISIVGQLILFVFALWLVYRILKGWLKLSDGKPVDA